MKYILILLIVLLAMSPFLYVEIKIYHDEQKIKSYLLNEKGYTEKEIFSIEGKLAKAPLFPITVIFNDEKHIEYEYRVTKTSVIQIGGYKDGFSDSRSKHVEKD